MDEPKRSQYEDDSEVEQYIQMLHSEDDEERFKAVNVLAWLKNKRAVEPLIELLDYDVYPHGWVCEALAELGDVRAVEPLIAYYNATKNYMALTALGKLKDKRAIPILLEALKDKDFDIQREAAKALGQFGGPEVVAPLIEALKESSSRGRLEIANVLGELGEVAVLPLLELLNCENSKVRAFTAHALGKIGDTRVVESLIVALKDTNYRVVRNAAYALGNIGDSSAIEPLTQLLQDSTDNKIRRKILQPLSQLIGEQITPLLIEKIYEEDIEMREEAIRVLSDFDNDVTISKLFEIVTDRNLDTKTRHIAIDALSDFRVTQFTENLREQIFAQFFEPLAEIVNDANEDTELRVFALSLISGLKDERVIHLIIDVFRKSENARLRLIAVRCLEHFISTEDLEILLKVLLEALQDGETWVDAAWLLGKLGDKRAFEPVIQAIERNGFDSRGTVVRALGNFHDPRAITILTEAIEADKELVREAAAIALGETADSNVVQPLIKALNDYNWRVRGFASISLGKVGDERAIPELERVARTDTGEIDHYSSDIYGRVRDIAAEAIEKIRQRMKDKQQ